MGFSQALRGGGSQSWALTKSLIHKPPAAPLVISPSTPEATTAWQEKLGHQTNSRPPPQRLSPDHSMSALPGTALPLTWTCRLLLSILESLSRRHHEPSASTTLAKVLLFIKKTLLPSKKILSDEVKGFWANLTSVSWSVSVGILSSAWEMNIRTAACALYSHAPVESLSMPPLLRTAQSHPSASPLWEAPGRSIVATVLVCVCKGDNNLSHLMGPEQLQPSQHRGDDQQMAETVQTPEARWHQWWWNISNTEINSRMRRGLLTRASPTQITVCCKHLGKAGIRTQGGVCPVQSFQQQLKLLRSSQWEETSLSWWFKMPKSGSHS